MKRTPAWLACLLIGVAVAASMPADGSSPAASGRATAVVAASNDFGFRLLHQLKAGQGDNAVISPISLAIALAMAQNGAAGSTRTAMAKTLGLGAMSDAAVNGAYRELLHSFAGADPATQLDIANALWLQTGFAIVPDFVAANRKFYGAEVANVDFQNHPDRAVGKINHWASRKTHGRITSILDPNPSFRFVVTDAVYFKGRWVAPFDKKQTQPQHFYPADGRTVDVPMMRREGEYSYFDDANLQAIEMFYGNTRFAMYIFLPRKPYTLAELMKSLDQHRWSELTAKLEGGEQKGTIAIPRFELRWGGTLNDDLKAIGMGVAFDSDADFSRAHLPPPPLVIDEVVQKTFMKVDEEGTEAAAVSAVAVGLMATMGGPRPFEMIVDHPFFCAIVERQTGAILFAGAITDPQAK
ncbi:MAG TPA: serpin family protein [Candidatus Binataceae bacterium]|nr:serpin family protein [Candidatus Binataceae bacterium]